MVKRIPVSPIFQFGQDIDGYPVRVLNERAVRAAAGLLLLGAFISFANAMMLGNFQPTRFFVLVFVLLTLTVLIASFSSIRSILGLKPAEVLHGR